MKTSHMRTIDLYVGGALCFLLDGYERIRRMFCTQKAYPRQIKKILVTKYLGMGSILLATPVMKALREAYPESHLVFLTFEQNAAFARRLNCFDEVRFFRTSSFSRLARDLFTMLPVLRREKYDLVMDLEFFARFSTIVSYVSGGRMRIGYYMPLIWRGDLLTHLVHFNPYRHVTEVFQAQLSPLGVTVTDASITPPEVVAAAKSRVLSLLGECGCAESERVIVVNPNASDLSRERRWPREYFETLITAAAALPGRKLILIGAPDESDYVATLHANLSGETRQRVFNMAGKLSVDEMVALLSVADLCISNDSGPLHIAAALGIPTVSFFGPETPTLYGPIGPHHEVFFAGLYCSPCLNVYNAKRAMCNGNNICMFQINPDTVIRQLLEKGIL